MSNYKQYQQVLNLTIRPESKSVGLKKGRSTKKSAVDTNSIKKRTKTGCLTCRKRKKKCDEDKVGGKCQACTRNFLECCWPEQENATPDVISVDIKCEADSSEVSSCCSESTVSSPKSPICIPTSPHNHYPSPAQSPVQAAEQDESEMKFIQLPPLSHNFKVTKKKGSAFELIPKNSTQAKFIVTSINNDKSLRQLST